MKVLQMCVSGLVLVSLASCSSTESNRRIDYGAGAKQISSLEMPPDLTAPTINDQYKLPQGEGGTVATFSDYSKGGTAPGNTASAVLPEIPGVRLERNGAQRWLVVSGSPAKVWSVARNFLLELGLSIKNEEQAAGVIETDWAENRGKIPQNKIRKVVGKEVNKENLAGERDQYLVRLERSKDGVSTEVHITHRGMVEVFSENMSTSKWHISGNDPELEAIMLQLLMVRFGVSEAQATSVMAEAGTVAATSAAPVNSVSDPAGTASLREVPGSGVIIVMNDAFDRSWRKVGLAIEAAGLAVEDKNREKGIYYLSPIKVAGGWTDSVDTKNRYRVNIKDGEAVCEVSVTDQNGAINKITKQITEAIYKHINQ